MQRIEGISAIVHFREGSQVRAVKGTWKPCSSRIMARREICGGIVYRHTLPMDTYCMQRVLLRSINTKFHPLQSYVVAASHIMMHEAVLLSRPSAP